jgi:hypothetical protein
MATTKEIIAALSKKGLRAEEQDQQLCVNGYLLTLPVNYQSKRSFDIANWCVREITKLSRRSNVLNLPVLPVHLDIEVVLTTVEEPQPINVTTSFIEDYEKLQETVLEVQVTPELEIVDFSDMSHKELDAQLALRGLTVKAGSSKAVKVATLEGK